MTNPTTPFNWQMPTSTDLVTDLPADFETFGQAVATSMADLLGGTTGQVLSKASNTDMDFTWVAQDDSNAIQNAIVDAKGDLIAATAADTPARLAVGTNGQVLTADSTAATGLAWATPSGGSNQFFAGKNKIINGDFYINQRAFTSNTTTQTYNFDRWYQAFSGGSQTVTPQTFTPGAAPVSGYEGKNFVQIVTASQSAAGDYSNYAQRIENVRNFAGQTTTVSFWAKATSGTPKLGVSGLQQFGTGGSPSADVIITGSTVTLSTSWARYSVTLSVPSISGKTLGTTDNTSILRLDFWTSAGTTISGAGYPTVGVQNTTIQIWGVQWEAGSTATDFQTATGTIQGELAACQRYYYRQTGSNYSSYGQGAAYSTTSAWLLVQHPVTMRKAPTVIEYSTLCLEYYGVSATALTALSIDSGANNPTVSLLVADVASGLTQYRPYRLANNANSSGYFAVNAEL